jgi:hypothetical protein
MVQLRAQVRHAKETNAQLEQALHAQAATDHLKRSLQDNGSLPPTRGHCLTLCEPESNLQKAAGNNIDAPSQISAVFAAEACGPLLDAAGHPAGCDSGVSPASVSGPMAQECRARHGPVVELKASSDAQIAQQTLPSAECTGNKIHQQGAQFSSACDKITYPSTAQV